MITLNLKAIPHFVTKDPTLIEEEKTELYRESYALFSFLLRHYGSLEMTIQRGATNLVRVQYRLPDLDAAALVESQRYFRFSVAADNLISIDECSFGEQLSLSKKVCLIPVGNPTRFREETEIMPFMAKFTPEERGYAIPLARPIKLLTTDRKWRNILAVLASTEGRLHIQIDRFTPRTFDVSYGLQCLQWYRHSYEGKLSPDELDTNTKIYQAIISRGEVYQVKIGVSGSNPDAIRLAVLRDIDLDTFNLDDPHTDRLAAQLPDPEEREFIELLRQLYSLEEVNELLTPPYTFGDALPGIPHSVPKPFILPFVNIHQPPGPTLLLGKLENEAAICIEPNQLRRHLFVTGGTGAGKTHTGQHILKQLNGKVPILVIDPIKREYEAFMEELGSAANIIDFRNGNYLQFNPFVPPPNISVYSHSAILAKTIAILFPTNDVAFELILNMVRQTYIWKLRQHLSDRKLSLEKFLDIDGAYLRANLSCIPTFDEFLGIGMGWLQASVGKNTRWGQEAIDHFRRRWEFLKSSMFKHIFSSAENPLKPVDSYFEANYLIELYNILDPNESNAIFALLVALLYEYRLSRGLQDGLKHVTVLEEAHRIIPSKQAGLGEDRVSSPAYEAAILLAQMLAEIRAYGEGIIIADQSPSKIIPDVLINTSTKIVHRILYGADKECLASALSLTPRESDYLSYLATGEAIAFLADAYQPLYITIPK